jgi:hypothetical protein
MDDFTNPAVDCFVEAMYTGEVEKLGKDIFEDVNKMAHVFKVSWLTKRCQKFYKSDVLNFDSNSYEEILFACEIASRAHYNLKQSYYVSCFVKNATFSGMSKSIFIQRYFAGFAKIPKRKIDMALAVASDDLKMISCFLTFYLSVNLECKEFDENSIYMLQKLDIHRLNRNFPSEFNELTDFLISVSKEAQCAEFKEILENYVKVKTAGESSSSKVEIEEDETSDDDYNEEFKDAANQTEEIKSGKCEKYPDIIVLFVENQKSFLGQISSVTICFLVTHM